MTVIKDTNHNIRDTKVITTCYRYLSKVKQHFLSDNACQESENEWLKSLVEDLNLKFAERGRCSKKGRVVGEEAVGGANRDDESVNGC